MAWRGGGMIPHRMVKVADGTYRSADPLPMYGKWKSMIRLEQVLRREERTDVPRWTWNGGYALLAVVGLLENAGITWLVGRGARGGRLRAAHLAAGEREREIA